MLVWDTLLVMALAWGMQDFPLASLVLCGAVIPGLVGLWRREAWGWWWSVTIHSLAAVTGPIAETVFVVKLVPEFDRPRGHME